MDNWSTDLAVGSTGRPYKLVTYKIQLTFLLLFYLQNRLFSLHVLLETIIFLANKPALLTDLAVGALVARPHYGLHVHRGQQAVAMVMMAARCAEQQLLDVAHVPTLDATCPARDGFCGEAGQ